MSGEISEELRIMMKEGIKSNLFPSYSTDTLNGRNTTKALLNVFQQFDNPISEAR